VSPELAGRDGVAERVARLLRPPRESQDAGATVG